MNKVFEQPETSNINLTISGKHRCDLKSPNKAWGVAVEYCYEDSEGRLWVGNIEYESQVNYCPVCGFKANVGI